MLSILICTLTSRKEQFERLNKFLEKQIEEADCRDDVEILVFEDDKDYPVGYKRNRLIEEASGEYICFVDDDDWVSDTYVSKIVSVLKKYPGVDCIGFKGLLVSKTLGNKEFIHSTQYKRYSEDKNYYYRPPNHLNIMRKELIKNYKFPDINFGEDADWTMNICKDAILKNEIFIDDVIYFYFYEPYKSETFPKPINLTTIKENRDE